MSIWPHFVRVMFRGVKWAGPAWQPAQARPGPGPGKVRAGPGSAKGGPRPAWARPGLGQARAWALA